MFYTALCLSLFGAAYAFLVSLTIFEVSRYIPCIGVAPGVFSGGGCRIRVGPASGERRRIPNAGSTAFARTDNAVDVLHVLGGQANVLGRVELVQHDLVVAAP